MTGRSCFYHSSERTLKPACSQHVHVGLLRVMPIVLRFHTLGLLFLLFFAAGCCFGTVTQYKTIRWWKTKWKTTGDISPQIWARGDALESLEYWQHCVTSYNLNANQSERSMNSDIVEAPWELCTCVWKCNECAINWSSGRAFNLHRLPASLSICPGQSDQKKMFMFVHRNQLKSKTFSYCSGFVLFWNQSVWTWAGNRGCSMGVCGSNVFFATDYIVGVICPRCLEFMHPHDYYCVLTMISGTIAIVLSLPVHDLTILGSL